MHFDLPLFRCEAVAMAGFLHPDGQVAAALHGLDECGLVVVDFGSTEASDQGDVAWIEGFRRAQFVE